MTKKVNWEEANSPEFNKGSLSQRTKVVAGVGLNEWLIKKAF